MSNRLVPASLLVAHRGNAEEFPENTLPAFESALDLGVTRLELDVQLSADRQPLVVHDDNLMRCAGLDISVLDRGWSELADASVGEPSRFGQRFPDVKIPQLTEVAELAKQNPQIQLFVELKRASIRRFGADLMLDRVYRALQQVRDQVILISFDLTILELAKSKCRLPVGWVLPKYSKANYKRAVELMPDYLFCDLDKLPGDHSRLWPGTWHWVIYEVESLRQARQLLQRGAQLLESMQVRSLLTALESADISLVDGL